MDFLESRTVGLDGVVAQQANYARSGFVLAHRNMRFGGTPQVEAPRSTCLRRVGPETVDAVLAYDRPFFPAPREAFLRCWLKPEERSAFAFVEDGTMKGYGVIRACRSGYKIGPLFCDDRADAELLLGALLNATGNGDDDIFLDVPQRNSSAMRLAHDIGLAPTFETVRMYRGPEPATALDRVFGVTSFELG